MDQLDQSYFISLLMTMTFSDTYERHLLCIDTYERHLLCIALIYFFLSGFIHSRQTVFFLIRVFPMNWGGGALPQIVHSLSEHSLPNKTLIVGLRFELANSLNVLDYISIYFQPCFKI